MSEEPVIKSRASRTAEQRRKSAERARASRERKKAERAPDARATDAALSEALSFHIARDGATTPIDTMAMMRTARLVLEREGFAAAPSAKAIADRLAHRPEHLDRDYIPSLRPGPVEGIRETRAGPWQTALDRVLEHIAGD